MQRRNAEVDEYIDRKLSEATHGDSPDTVESLYYGMLTHAVPIPEVLIFDRESCQFADHLIRTNWNTRGINIFRDAGVKVAVRVNLRDCLTLAAELDRKGKSVVVAIENIGLLVVPNKNGLPWHEMKFVTVNDPESDEAFQKESVNQMIEQAADSYHQNVAENRESYQRKNRLMAIAVAFACGLILVRLFIF